MAVVIDRSTLDSVPRGEHIGSADERIVLWNRSWADFEMILAMRGDRPRPRVAFYRGALELTSPSIDHEQIKKRFATVLEAHLDHLGIRYEGVGSRLLEHAPSEVGIEPDECYILEDASKKRPDIAIEVVWTSGGIDKLAIYEQLGVPEVWYWRTNQIRFHALGHKGYEDRERSKLLPGFDPQIVDEMLDLAMFSDVRAALRKRFG